MALPVTIPNQFANATSSIPLSQLDGNFSTLANAVNGINSGSETLANLVATTANVTTGNIVTVNSTTVDTTNIEVTNIKAKDGTSAGSIANSTGVVTIASSVLTTTDINGGTIDATVIGGSNAAAITGTTITADTSVSTDTISEKTSAAGVTIDSVLLKDNKVTANELTINSNNISADNSLGFRNRIINGDMRIDQRNAGAAVTADGAFPVDRFQVVNITDGAFSAQQDSSAPAGFQNSLKFTTTTADASLGATQFCVLAQSVEGFNMADFDFGLSSAKTVTLSFWVRSSLTGTFGGVLKNGASNRSYPYTYTITSADTWEYKSVTIAGDTTGTWLKTNGRGAYVQWGLGVGSTYSGTAGAWAGTNYISATGATSVIGTLNATWFVTGVQLEVGSVATPFERRPYGTELALCQRYFYNWTSSAAQTYSNLAHNIFNNLSYGCFVLPVLMRANPTLTTSGTASHYGSWQGGTQLTCSVVPAIDIGHPQTPFLVWTYSGTPLTVAGTTMCRITNTSAFLGFNAEL